MLKHPHKSLGSSELVRKPEFQLCERRLVLSAQLLFDALSDQSPQSHVMDSSLTSDPSSLPIQPHASSAHALTGWDQVQQEFGLTGKGQTVAVIDSGIAWDHVALGKGFGSGYRVVGGWDFTEENDARPYDDGPAGFHGTHVAGIIGSDDPTRTGVAPGVDFVALRVFNDAGQGQIGWVEKALQWVHNNRNAFENPITTVNLSIGTQLNANSAPGWATFEDELKQLHEDGIVVTASAGNSFKQYNSPGLSYPASSQYVLPVASVDDNGQLSDFSQRSDRVVAAPGRNILSTVPDHLLGRDGKINDFSTATGTSMAAPYVAGASVLVREAMEMVGWSNITADSIAEHLRNTADQVFDTITRTSYDRLDLQQAIDAIIPDDTIGDTSSNAASLDLQSGKMDGWINSLHDSDIYRFTADSSGQLQFSADSQWLDTLNWSISSSGQILAEGDQDAATINLVAGRSYEIRIDADAEIGPFELEWKYQVDASPNGEANATINQLGETAYSHKQVQAGSGFRLQAANDGLMTILWHNPDSAAGALQVSTDGKVLSDATWDNGELRLDVSAKAGQWFDIRTPGLGSDQADLTIANVLSQTGKDVRVVGTSEIDAYELNLQNGTSLSIGDVQYDFAPNSISTLQIDGGGGGDQIVIRGSTQAEDVYLRPSNSNLEVRDGIKVALTSVEQIQFHGGGGADGAYLYDSDGNDTLIARSNEVDMTGSGYRFIISGVARVNVHATAGGQDIGYFYDSPGNDRLNIRPQFSSLSGDGYSNYISGIERVYAYANAGGFDTAEIYDSPGDDRFAASGDTASTSGSGFNSYTKGFEQVKAFATAGGHDIASLYASTNNVEWLHGADFVSFEDASIFREARGFDSVEKFANSLPIPNAVFGTSGSLPGQDFSATATNSDSPPFIHQQVENGAKSCSIDFEEGFQPSTLIHEAIRLETPMAGAIDLPEELLMSDTALELDILDQIFSLIDGK